VRCTRASRAPGSLPTAALLPLLSPCAARLAKARAACNIQITEMLSRSLTGLPDTKITKTNTLKSKAGFSLHKKLMQHNVILLNHHMDMVPVLRNLSELSLCMQSFLTTAHEIRRDFYPLLSAIHNPYNLYLCNLYALIRMQEYLFLHPLMMAKASEIYKGMDTTCRGNLHAALVICCQVCQCTSCPLLLPKYITRSTPSAI